MATKLSKKQYTNLAVASKSTQRQKKKKRGRKIGTTSRIKPSNKTNHVYTGAIKHETIPDEHRSPIKATPRKKLRSNQRRRLSDLLTTLSTRWLVHVTAANFDRPPFYPPPATPTYPERHATTAYRGCKIDRRLTTVLVKRLSYRVLATR